MISGNFDRTLTSTETYPYTEPQVDIRPVDPENEHDIQRLRLIDQDPVRIWEFEGDNPYQPLADDELREFAHNSNEKLFLAVVGSPHHEAIGTGEVDQVQGWVKIIPDSPSRINQLRANGIVTSQPDEDILKISCAKLNGAPRGQMASAIRQVCMLFGNRNMPTPSSDEALPAIVAYITPNNTSSIKMVEAAGFVKQDPMIKYEEGHPPNFVYALNWTKLQGITQHQLSPS